MKCKPQKLLEVVETLAHVSSYTECARRCFIGHSTLWRWIQASQKSPEEWLFKWGDNVAPFHEHCTVAGRIYAHSLESEAVRRAMDGWEEPVFYQGKPSWKEDETLTAWTDDEVKEILGLPDRYLRVNGKRVQHTVKHAPNVALVLGILKAKFPGVYGVDHRTVDVRSQSVLVIKGNKRPAAPVLQASAEDIIDVESTEVVEQIAPPDPLRDALAKLDSLPATEMTASLRREIEAKLAAREPKAHEPSPRQYFAPSPERV